MIEHLTNSTTFRAAIIEDNEQAAQSLLQTLRQITPEVEVVGMADSVSTAIELLENTPIDIAFMDIELAPGTSFDVLKTLKERNKLDFQIIFVTAYSRIDYAMNAIYYSCMDYVTKPVEPHRLQEAINKAKDQYIRINMQQIDTLLSNLSIESQSDYELTLPLQKREFRVIKSSDIVWAEAADIICYFYMKNGEKITCYRNLGYFKQALENDKRFFKASNGSLVNLGYIRSYDLSTESRRIVMTNKQIIQASKRQITHLEEAIRGYKKDHSTKRRTLWEFFFGKK